ncbi:uncharacterized protein LOC6046696 [Culex quinquefasciatus]|uniref:uncharacterized protein LOC6046696 n=1 Tax=Culex quinquefasciatus TaxID=7176 RepID=UPI0018E347C5|nr:uncharacterized protein LOC6046696 [Culex quinquefasciatus]
MDQYEEDILRLNRKIRHLIAQNDTLETRNREVSVLNRALLEENEELKRTHGSTSQLADRCRVELEKMTEQRDQLYAANQKHKERYRALLERHTLQGEKVKTLEHSLQSATATRRIAHVPVEIIGKVSDIGKVKALQDRCQKLEKDLATAYVRIDDLEFEIESIDFLEEENDRLQQEVRRLQSASGDPKTPAPAAEPPRSPTRSFSTDSFSSTSSSTSSVDQVPTSEAATAEVTTKLPNTFIP